MQKEYQKSSNLDLYDLCIIIDRSPGNTKDLGNKIGVSDREVARRIKKLREIGVGIKSVNYIISKDQRYNFFQYELEEPIYLALEKIDKAIGLPEPFKKSIIVKEEQEEVIALIIQVNNNSKHWPENYFSDQKKREERLRIIIPFCLDNILVKDPTEVKKKDLENIGFKEVIKNYFDKSLVKFLQTSYPWLTKADRTRNYYLKYSALKKREKILQGTGFEPA